MMLTEGRVLCMENYQKYIIVGTFYGYVIVFDAETKTKLNKIKLKDAVPCIKVLPTKDRIVLGLANGEMMSGSIAKLINGGILYFCLTVIVSVSLLPRHCFFSEVIFCMVTNVDKIQTLEEVKS